jgi:flagella basal body P-ring formation protein FlgA
MNRILAKLERLVLGLAVVAAVLVGRSATESRAAEIRMRPQAMPSSTVVRLGDVADVAAESNQEARRLAAVPLMPAPAQGTHRYLRMREVQDLLAAHGEDMSRLRFQGERVIDVAAPAAADQPAERTADNAQPNVGELGVRNARREAWLGVANPLTDERADAQIDDEQASARRSELRERLRQAIVDHLTQQAGQGAWQVELNVSSQYLDSLPRANSQATCEGGRAPWTGRQRFFVSYPTADGAGKFALTADVTRPQRVVVAIRPIERGSIVTASHVAVEERDSLPANGGRRMLIDSLENVLGKEASRTIQAGQILFDDDAHAPLLVKRNETVTVFARGGGIQVRTAARARQNGARGELVQVESLETRERYDAVVVGLREAVVFSAGSASASHVPEPPRQPLPW